MCFVYLKVLFCTLNYSIEIKAFALDIAVVEGRCLSFKHRRVYKVVLLCPNTSLVTVVVKDL